MNARIRISIGKAAAIFIGLALLFAILLVAANRVPNTLAQLVQISSGSALFGSGLTFFLIRATQPDVKE